MRENRRVSATLGREGSGLPRSRSATTTSARFSDEPGDGTTTMSSEPVQVTALGTDVLHVAAGLHATCARKSDGTLWCWGTNAGDGTSTSPTAPTAPLLVCPRAHARVFLFHFFTGDYASLLELDAAIRRCANVHSGTPAATVSSGHAASSPCGHASGVADQRVRKW